MIAWYLNQQPRQIENFTLSTILTFFPDRGWVIVIDNKFNIYSLNEDVRILAEHSTNSHSMRFHYLLISVSLDNETVINQWNKHTCSNW